MCVLMGKSTSSAAGAHTVALINRTGLHAVAHSIYRRQIILPQLGLKVEIKVKVMSICRPIALYT